MQRKDGLPRRRWKLTPEQRLGHAARCRALAAARRGRPLAEEHRRKISARLKGRHPYRDKKTQEELSAIQLKIASTVRLWLKKHGHPLQGRKMSKTTCTKLRTAWARDKDLRRASLKHAWDRLTVEERSARIRAALSTAGLRGQGHLPNRLELAVQTYLDHQFPGQWCYNHGEFVIAGRVPDFVNVNGSKAVLEIFGDHWHQGQDPREHAAKFERVGYRCTVIWESEFRANPSIVRLRLGEDHSYSEVPLTPERSVP